MVIGAYRLTDIHLNTLPPGTIDHREWTLENGRNNALRINGLGAPRAFFTPEARDINLPNVLYGEDYALGSPSAAITASAVFTTSYTTAAAGTTTLMVI